MAGVAHSLSPDYWKTVSITKKDIDFLNNYLFENETPLTEKELAPVLIAERIRLERQALLKQQQAGGRIFIPRESYKVGDRLVFPALDWQNGRVMGKRPGLNPELGEFEVIEVVLEGEVRRNFASGLAEHKLNQPIDTTRDDPLLNPQYVLQEYGEEIEQKLFASLKLDAGLVRIAGRWFPQALLVEVGVGHLNLAEAVLDEADGKPLPASALIEQAELPAGVNLKLVEFSVNYALQEDGRFDEVGPAGEVLWCLRRLEPPDVQQVPEVLRYTPINYDRSVLTHDMLALEAEIDDELSDGEALDLNEATLSLTYPHWRSGTLPVSARVRRMFPTAYESPRVRFTLVDGQSKEEIPAWVVRQNRYVVGLSAWFNSYGLIPGSLIVVQKSKKPGEVIIRAKTRRPTREWVRTVLVGRDGGIVFAMLKQNVAADYHERMIVAVTDSEGLDQARLQLVKARQPFDRMVVNTMQELTKLNVQGHVHAQELYSAINIFLRCPPGPLLGHLATQPGLVHVGDLHYRVQETA